MIAFMIPGNPPTVTAQQKGQNRHTGQYYKPPELRDAEQKYLAYAAQHRPPAPILGPVELHVVFGYQTTGKHTHGEPKTTKPDTDNAIKAVKDALTKARYWKDDAQVAVEVVSKIWVDVPGIAVTVYELKSWREKKLV